jgi:paraquat-inducible protein B
MQSFVTGQSEIDLNFDAASAAVLHPNVTSLPEIPTQQSTMQRVTEQLSKLPLRELTDNASATLQSLKSLSEKLDRSLPPLIDSLKTTSDRSAEVIGNAGHSITELQGRLDETLADISRLATAGDRQLTQRGGELRTALISTNQTVVQARDLLTDLKSLTSERGADRANIDSALRDLATSASSLRGLASEVERNPQLLLTGRRP